MTAEVLTPAVSLHAGDCLDVLRAMPPESVDCVVTDPPYELGFMGKTWDRSGVAFTPATWAAVLRTVKPGGYMLAFAGSRTQHRIGCAIEDGGWEIRDCLLWLHGQGFPKGKGCLKPAYEPIILARRPGPKVLPLGVDECRVETAVMPNERRTSQRGVSKFFTLGDQQHGERHNPAGRYPANLLHDGNDEVMEAFAGFGEKTSGVKTAGAGQRRDGDPDWRLAEGTTCYADTGTAARFFYTAKASKAERGDGNTHPTVKPLALMRWLVRLVCPPGGVALDPFAGSGTTGLAAVQEGRRAVLVEKETAYCDIIRDRLNEKGTLFPLRSDR